MLIIAPFASESDETSASCCRLHSRKRPPCSAHFIDICAAEVFRLAHFFVVVDKHAMLKKKPSIDRNREIASAPRCKQTCALNKEIRVLLFLCSQFQISLARARAKSCRPAQKRRQSMRRCNRWRASHRILAFFGARIASLSVGGGDCGGGGGGGGARARF